MDALLAAAEDDMSGDELVEEDIDESQLNTYSPEDLFGDDAADETNGASAAGEPVNGIGKTYAVEERPTSAVDDGQLQCKITEFFPLNNKMVYRIECNTSLPGYKVKKFDVLRKYEDFLWLHDRLTENRELAGVLIPHLPPKVTWVNPEPGQIAQKVSYNDGFNVKLTDQFQRRAHQLYRFLRRVCRHELLRKDIHVVVFLEFEEDLKPINKKSWWSSPWYVPRHGMSDDAEGAEVRRWASRYSLQLAVTAPAAEYMTLASRGLATAEIALMHELKAWAGDHRIVQVFRHFSTGLIRSQINHHLRAQVEESLQELLEDYMGTVDATKGMLDRVNALASELEEVQKHRAKATHSMIPAGDPKADRQKAQLGKLNEEFVSAKDVLGQARENRRNEIQLAQKRRAGDFKETFVALCEHEIHQGKQRIQTWEEILREIQLLGERAATVQPRARSNRNKP